MAAMVSLSDENAMPVMSVCELCGMNFPSAAQLETHRARFCQGSGLHREVLARRNMERNAIAGNLQEDEITAISRGLAGLSDDAFGMTGSHICNTLVKFIAPLSRPMCNPEALLNPFDIFEDP